MDKGECCLLTLNDAYFTKVVDVLPTQDMGKMKFSPNNSINVGHTGLECTPTKGMGKFSLLTMAVCVTSFISYLPYVGGFLRVLRFPPPEN